MQQRSEAERRATTGPMSGFDKGRPGEARSAAKEAGRSSLTNNVVISCYLRYFT